MKKNEFKKISKIVEKAEVLEHAIAISIYDEQRVLGCFGF